MSIAGLVLDGRSRLRKLVANPVLAVFLLGSAMGPVFSAESDFLFMEAVESKGRPDSLEEYGLKYLHVVNPRKDIEFEGGDKKNMVVRSSLEDVARSVVGEEMVCIDIESWPTCNVCSKRVRSLKRYNQVLDWYRNINDKPQLGFFGRPPKHDYFNAIKPPSSRGYRDWQRHNAFYEQLGERVDVLFPSLYARYDDVDGWVRHAVENLKEARRYNKPVYAFITPYFIESDKPYAKTPLDVSYWEIQLETAYNHADGLVIWTGPLKKWSSDDPWWIATKAFLKSKGAGNPGNPVSDTEL